MSVVFMDRRTEATYHVEVVGHNSVTPYGAPIACGGQRTNDAGADQNGQVEAVLGVP